MNQIVWHPELISSEGLAKVLSICKERGQDLTMEEITQIISLIAPLLSKPQQGTVFYDWFMARAHSGKLTEEEREWMRERLEKRDGL